MNAHTRRRGVSWLQVAVICTAIVVSSAASATAAKMITTKQIKNSAITTAKIKNKAVTNAKIRNNAVTAAKIRKGAVQQKHLAAGLGVQGPAGPQGIQGPAGRDGVQGTVVRLSTPIPVAHGGQNSRVATCEAGEEAVGGGGYWINQSNGAVVVYDSPPISGGAVRVDGQYKPPIPGTPADRWIAYGTNVNPNNNNTYNLVAHVICTKP